MLEMRQVLPEVSTYIHPGSLESSKVQEKIQATSNVTEAPTPNPGDTNQATTDHAPITTELRSYEVVGDGYTLKQKMSKVSNTLPAFRRFSMLRPFQTRNKIPTGDVRVMLGTRATQYFRFAEMLAAIFKTIRRHCQDFSLRYSPSTSVVIGLASLIGVLGIFQRVIAGCQCGKPNSGDQ